jgi:outer membrane protein assembly factor BamA
VKRSVVVLSAAITLASPSAAQIPDLPTLGPDWVDLAFPKVYYSPTEGLGTGLYYAQIKQLGYDDWDAPPPYRAILSLDGNISTSGSKRLRLEARMPQLIDGWRFVVSLEARRDARQGYFGIGITSAFDDANVSDAQPHFYRSDNQRLIARSEIQRRIVGGLRVLAGIHAERWRIDTLSGASQLAADASSGMDPTIGRNTGDVTGRVGLVFDTRNDEPAPTRGVLLEAILGFADSTIAGALSYTRATVSATAYVPLRHHLTIAARIAGQSMGGAPRLGSYYLVEASDRPFLGVGGGESHRALPDERFLDADKLFANLDVRYDLLAQPTLFRFTAVAFLDAGRVFPQGEFKLTAEDVKVGGGLGFFAQFFRSGILGFTAGLGPDGVIWNVHTRWPF